MNVVEDQPPYCATDVKVIMLYMCLINKIPNILGHVFCSLVQEFPEMSHSRIIISTKTNALTLQHKRNLINAAAYRVAINSLSAHRLRAVQSALVIL